MSDEPPNQTKTLGQIKVDGFDQDLALGDRYTGFSGELLRLVLLAIGGVGYLLKTPPVARAIPADHKLLLWTAIMMGICAASAWAHRYIASEMLACELRLARLCYRSQEGDLAEAQNEFKARKWRMNAAGPLLGISASFLLAGTILFIVAIWL